MKKSSEIRRIGRSVVRDELRAVSRLKDSIDADFVRAVQLILAMKGRVIVTGIGKSAIIAAKVASTLNSTGTPAIFMHAADAVHGDLGIVQRGDIVLCLSKSGSSPEIKALAPLIRTRGNTLIAMAGNRQSYLAKHADLTLDVSVEKEACPNNLAPTSSTTAQLVMGDALAVCLLACRGFSRDDFARVHPGGALGRQLYLTVADLCIHNERPQVGPDAGIKDVILEISSKRLGVTAVTGRGGLKGVITDGDLRRMLERGGEIQGLKARDIMGKKPKTVAKSELAVKALEIMEENNITQLLVTDKGRYAGVIHLHDLLKEGII